MDGDLGLQAVGCARVDVIRFVWHGEVDREALRSSIVWDAMSVEETSCKETSRTSTLRTAPAGMAGSPSKVIVPVTALRSPPQATTTSARAEIRMMVETRRMSIILKH